MRFRPEHDTRIGDDKVDWEDNAVSNAFAWASFRITPAWCQTPEHWTARLSNYLFTDCPCCMFFRGVTVGVVISAALWLAAFAFALWLMQ